MADYRHGIIGLALTGLFLGGCGDVIPTSSGLMPPDMDLLSIQDDVPEDSLWLVFFDRSRVARGEVSQRAGNETRNSPGVKIREVYEGLGGFAAALPPEAVAALQNNPIVSVVARNKPVAPYGFTTQTGAPWGLDRIDQTAASLNGTYTYTRNGSNVRIYIVDFGVSVHDEFQFNRRIPFYAPTGVSSGDCMQGDGHGTGIASVAAGTNFGVAKGADVFEVKVGDCSWQAKATFVNSVASALNHIVVNHQGGPAVVNMSIGVVKNCPSYPGSSSGPGEQFSGGGCPDTSAAMNDAAAAVIQAGFPVVAAAGNSLSNACGGSPGTLPAVITVGATNASNERWLVNSSKGSNYGPCLDLFAPGAGILAASKAGTTASVYMSGTSLAAPFVSGAVALYLQDHPTATPAQVHTAITGYAHAPPIINPGTGSPNRLLLIGGPLEAGIEGWWAVPAGTWEWDAEVEGGIGDYTYQWYRRWRYSSGSVGSWTALGTASSQAITFNGHEPDFDLRVDVASGAQSDMWLRMISGPCHYSQMGCMQ